MISEVDIEDMSDAIKKPVKDKELIDKTHRRCGYHKYEIRDVFEALKEAILDTFLEGRPVVLDGIGTIYVYETKPYETTNPYSGGTMTVKGWRGHFKLDRKGKRIVRGEEQIPAEGDYKSK